ncbi:MAG: hypothetical protein HOK67_33490 [Deltaproteobacteria bacterium]|jgi:DNA-binding response OmpR family regulator|nr:hypothetical protein [Deltaproteobacteria bacterium]MBT4263131.1 hypothetical protein [Deltaproteobacteria bacterium]MBT4637333.1 hypothetical protein [Deltaproteobacteria bacterium]MBT6504813.1 hypothetical protein [Deltaproteobacteria bacterium]MBT7152738.1 hypothetical protein [Deltaproteobacteria bacterium]
MHKSILVLEESAMVHDLFESALPKEYWDWRIEHESFQENYVSKAEDMLPGIIFLSNQDQKNDYVTVKELRISEQLKDIPILLLTIAKDKLDEKQLQSLGVQGFLRKPFESATLLEQIEATLQDQTLQPPPRDELESINIIDDELRGLLSGNASSEITIDNLEEVLDPTLQLHPIEAESMLLDNEDDQLDAIEEMTDFIEEDNESLLEDNMPDEFEFSEDDEDELDEFEQDRAETEAIEIELEEIGLDIDEYSHDITSPASAKVPAAEDHRMTKIAIVIDRQDSGIDSLKNESGFGEIGLMEIDVIPCDVKEALTAPTAGLFEEVQVDRDPDTSLTEEAGFLTELKVTHNGPDRSIQARNGSIVENITDSLAPSLPFTELEVSQYQADDVIEIEHTEIRDEIDDDYEAVSEEEFDDSDLLEISVEGFDTEEVSDEMLSDDIDELEIDEDPFSDSTDFGEDEELLIEDLDEEALLADDLDEPEVVMDAMAEEDLSEIVISNVEDEDSENFQDDEDLQEIGGIEDLGQFEQEQGEAEPPFIEQDEMNGLEIDFEADDASQTDETTADEFNLQMDEFEDLDSDSAQMSIQEMINFRQVMKAKYDIPELSATESDEAETAEEDLEIGIMSDDEIDHLDLADTSEDEENGPAFEEESLDEDMDMVLEEFSDEDDADENGETEADTEEIDIIAEIGDDKSGEINIFADPDDDDTGEVDLFADTDDDESEEIDIFADPDDDDTGGVDLFTDDEPQESDSLEAPAEDLFLESDEGDVEEDDLDLLAEAPEMDGEETLFEDIPHEPSIASDEIDLLTDDLHLSDDFAATTENEQTESDELFDGDIDTELVVDKAAAEPDDFFSEPIEEAESDILESPEMDLSDEIFSDHEVEEDDDVFEEVDLLEEETSDNTESEIAFDPDSMMNQDMSDLEMINEMEDVTIDVPQEIFEISDLKMGDITHNLDEDTEPVGDEFPLEETELTEDIELPSLDEDLPDLPSIGEDMEAESDIFEDASQTESSEATQNDIEVLQSENDFESVPDESETIEFSDEQSAIPETETIEEPAPVAKKRSLILSPDVRDKLSGMIESVISDTIQSTLHEMLPEMMDKIIQEELDD